MAQTQNTQIPNGAVAINGAKYNTGDLQKANFTNIQPVGGTLYGTPKQTSPNNTPMITGYKDGVPVQVPKGATVPGVSLYPPKTIKPDTFDVTKDQKYQELLKKNEELLASQKTQTDANAAGTAAGTDAYSNNLNSLASDIKANIQPTFTPEQQKANNQGLLDTQAKQRTLKQNFQSGVDMTGEQAGVPMSDVRGQQATIQNQYNRQAGVLSDQEANLLSAVNLSSQERQALVNGDITLASIQDKVQSHIDSATKDVLDQAKTLTTQAQTNLASALDSLKGTTWKDLSQEQQNQLYTLAQQGGYPVSVLQAGMDAVAKQTTLDNATKNKPNIEVIGEHYDENAGAMVKDYGYIDNQGNIKKVDGTPYTGTPTQEGNTTDSISAFKSSITTQESGNYSAVNKDSGALGAYQFMPTTGLPLVGLDPNKPADIQKFLNTPALQDQAFEKFVGNLSAKYGGDTTKMAAAYYGEDGAAQIVGTPAANKPQGKNGEYPSINEYVKQVGDRMNKITGATNQNEPADPKKYEQYGLLSNTDFNPAVDGTAKLYLDSYLKNATLPTAYNLGLGRGASGANKFAKAEARAQELYYAATGSSLPDVNILKDTKKIVTENNKVLNKNVLLADTVAKNFDLAIKGEITNNVNKNATIVNKILNPIYLALGDPAVNQAMVSNGTISQEFANLISIRNASGTTVADKEMANELIRFGTSVEAQKAVVERLKAEATNIHGALVDQNAQLYKIIDPLETSTENPNRQNKVNGGDVKNEYPSGAIVNVNGKNYKSLGNGQFEEIK
jgi:hypothetical protein